MGYLTRLLAAKRRREQPTLDEPYRGREPAETPEQIVDEIRATIAGLELRVRVLERQLQARGEAPALTPAGEDLLLAADVLMAVARGQRVVYSTVGIESVAKALRGLARWSG